VEYKSPRGRDAGRKAQNFADYAKQYGWTSKWSESNGVTHLFCRRGESETIDVWWQDNGCVMPGMEPIYTLAGERIKLRNLSAAAKVAEKRPDPERLKRATKKRKGIEYAGAIDGLRTSLPFDDESDDDEIEAVLHNRLITWMNRLSGQLYSARVNADKKFRVIRKDLASLDQIEFTDEEGFHAVYLHSIVSVAG
jgi:hypothetical protein